MKVVFIIFTFYLMTFFLDCISIPDRERYNKYFPVKNFKRTYIKFKIPAVDDKLAKDEKGYYFYAFVRVGEWLLLDPLECLNPDESYWKKYYGDIRFLPERIKDDLRTCFLENCEYRIPAPVGKTRYIFHLSIPPKIRSASLEIEIDLPENHSIRINIKEKPIPYKNPKGISERADNDHWENRDKYEIIPVVEPNPEPDPDLPCNVESY